MTTSKKVTICDHASKRLRERADKDDAWLHVKAMTAVAPITDEERMAIRYGSERLEFEVRRTDQRPTLCASTWTQQ